MVQIIIIIFMTISLILNKFIYGNIKNLPSLITIIWCSSLFLATLGLYNIYVPDNVVVWYALIFVSSFNVFSFIFKKTKKVSEQKPENIDIRINDKALSALLIICITLLMFICRESINIFLETKSFSNVRNAFINYESIGVHMQVFISILLIPFGKAIYILSAIDYVYNKKLKISLILSIIFVLLVTLLTGGRSYLYFLVLTFIVPLFLKNSNFFKTIKNNKKVIRICILAILLFVIITISRGFKNNGIFTSLYVYFAGCFNLFGVYLKRGLVIEPSLLYGQALVSGFSFPFLQISRYLFGTNILPGNYILAEEATSKYMAISNKIVISATPTSMYFAIRDFGIIGLIIYPLIISYFYQKLKKKRNTNLNILNEANFVYFISSSILLNMAYQFGTFQCISVFIYIYIICKTTYSNKGKENTSNEK